MRRTLRAPPTVRRDQVRVPHDAPCPDGHDRAPASGWRSGVAHAPPTAPCSPAACAPHWHSSTFPRHWPTTLSCNAWRASVNGQTWSTATISLPDNTQSTSTSKSSAEALGMMAENLRPFLSPVSPSSSNTSKRDVEMKWPPGRKTRAAASSSPMHVAQPTQSSTRSRPTCPTVGVRRLTQSSSLKLMTSLAPKSIIHSTLLGGTVVNTVAPFSLAICTAKCPTPRLPPRTRTFDPAVMAPNGWPFVEQPAPVSNAWKAVKPLSGSPATLSNEDSGGTLTLSVTTETCDSGHRQSSEKPPAGPNSASSSKDSAKPRQQTTWSPSPTFSQPGPTAITSPATSKPGTKRNLHFGKRSRNSPLSNFQSIGSTAA
mmetsp:Transcript_90026/g.259469  ORF Transcript_90026/g.259469 Transcript_90026/m.259469 type:complete len:371 (+) Transcript_90026:212-1324(+)